MVMLLFHLHSFSSLFLIDTWKQYVCNHNVMLYYYLSVFLLSPGERKTHYMSIISTFFKHKKKFVNACIFEIIWVGVCVGVCCSESDKVWINHSCNVDRIIDSVFDALEVGPGNVMIIDYQQWLCTDCESGEITSGDSKERQIVQVSELVGGWALLEASYCKCHEWRQVTQMDFTNVELAQPLAVGTICHFKTLLHME